MTSVYLLRLSAGKRSGSLPVLVVAASVAAIVAGVVLRFTGLGGKLVWHDAGRARAARV